MVIVQKILEQLNNASEDPIHGSTMVSKALDILTNASDCLMNLACGELTYIHEQLEEYQITHDTTILLDCISELELFDNSEIFLY